MTSKDWDNIGKNLGRLYFAGEATSEDWCGYMQGAYLTGDKKGNVIADKISPRESYNTRKSEATPTSPSKPGKPKSEATLAKVSSVGILLLPLWLITMWK